MLREVGHYHGFATVLHWLMAFLIIVMIGLGLYMSDLPETSPERFELFQLHKSTGITIFLLAFVRLFWRLTHRDNFRSLDISPFERVSSHIVHGLFYLLMFALPVSGWVMVSSAPVSVPTFVYGLIPWPDLPIPDGAARARVHENSHSAHEVLAYIAAALLLLHVLAALKHHYLNRDGVLVRMVPRVAGGWPGYFVMIFLSLVILVWVWLSFDPFSDERDGPAADAQAPAVEAPAIPGLRGADWPDTLALDESHGELRFYWYQPTEPEQGEFSRFRVHLNLDEGEPGQQFLDVDIAMDDLRVGSPDAAAMLPDEDWFYSSKYPVASFRSTHIEREDSDWRIFGTLSIRDISQPVDFLLRTAVLEDDLLHLYGEFSLVRQDFGVGQGDWQSDEYVGSEVLIQFDLKYASTQRARNPAVAPPE